MEIMGYECHVRIGIGIDHPPDGLSKITDAVKEKVPLPYLREVIALRRNLWLVALPSNSTMRNCNRLCNPHLMI